MVGRWRAATATALGASHVQRGLPNQDAIEWRAIGAGAGAEIIVAVADGHGSLASFRSATGAQFAVEAAMSVVQAWLARTDQEDLSVERRSRDDQAALSANLLDDWHARVKRHLHGNPFTPDELAALDEHDKRSRGRIERNPSIAYGSTVLAAATTQDGVLLVQLGDGDIMAVSHDGTAAHPLPADDRLIGNETTSLCTSRPSDVRVGFVAASSVDLVLLSTDGYSNSFLTDDDFAEVGPEILGMVREHGFEWVTERMAGWLEQATRDGSGDDISLGLLWLSDSTAPIAPASGAAPTIDAGQAAETAKDEPADVPPRRLDDGPGARGQRAGRGWLVMGSLLLVVALVLLVVAILFLLSQPPPTASPTPSASASPATTPTSAVSPTASGAP